MDTMTNRNGRGRVMDTTQDTIRKMVPQVLDREEVIRELAATWELRPTGGTERERRAWKNGFREAVAALGGTPMHASDCTCAGAVGGFPPYHLHGCLWRDDPIEAAHIAQTQELNNPPLASEAMAPRGSDGEIPGLLF